MRLYLSVSTSSRFILSSRYAWFTRNRSLMFPNRWTDNSTDHALICFESQKSSLKNSSVYRPSSNWRETDVDCSKKKTVKICYNFCTYICCEEQQVHIIVMSLHSVSVVGWEVCGLYEGSWCGRETFWALFGFCCWWTLKWCCLLHNRFRMIFYHLLSKTI